MQKIKYINRQCPNGIYQDRRRLKANIGNYHIDQAYGGVKLVQMMGESGGIRNVLSMGYETKANCYNAIHAYIKGIEDCIFQEKELNSKIKSNVTS